LLALAVAAGAGVGACGGAAPTELFDPVTTMDAGSHPDTSTGVNDSSALPPVDSSLPPVVDSAVKDTNPPDTTTQIDSSPPGMGISCGVGLTCTKNQFCCATSDPQMMNPTTYACQDSSQTSSCTAAGGTPVTCDFGSDCVNSNGICCGTLATDQYTHVRCESTCNTASDRTFCDPTAVPDPCIANGMMCGPSTILPGFFACQ
jgi:hypothetical protein